MSHSHKSLAVPKIADIKLKHIVPLVIIVLALYVILPQLEMFKYSLEVVRSAELKWMILGFGCILISVSSAAGTYRFLTVRQLRYQQIAVIQFSSMFISRLLPAGLGGISLFIAFFYKQKHTFGQATAIVAVNSILGVPGHILVALLCVLVFGITLPAISFPEMQLYHFFVLLVIATIVILSMNKIVSKLSTYFSEVIKTLKVYKNHVSKLAAALICAMSNTSFHVLALYFVFLALAIDLTVGAAFIVMTTGVIAGTASPTPGGLVGAEAGITFALVSYGIEPSIALAGALSYRLLSYWIPLLLGIPMFSYARHKKYV